MISNWRGRDFGVVLFVLEAHGALDFSRGVDELAQRIERQRVIVAAGGNKLELAGLVIYLFGVLAGKQKALDLGGGVEGVLFLGVELVGVVFQDAAKVARVEGAVLVDDGSEHQHLAVAEDVGGNPVERAPVNAQAQVALFLGGKAANG